MDVDLQMEKERLKLPYKNLSNRYRYGKDDVDKFQKRQYIYIYRSRIESLKGRIVAKARQLLNNPNLNETIIADGDVSRRKNALIVGTVFKRMKFRQSILYEFADDSNLHMKFTRKANENLTDDEDLLELEFCQQQLIKLSGKINKHHLVTGDIIGVFGSQQNADDFFVVDKIILPEIAQQIPWPIIEQDCYVAFVSGMSLSGDMGKCMKTFLALDALQKWINGEIVPDEEEECNIVQNVVRLVVAGDFCRFNPIELPQQKVAVIGFSYEVDVDCLGQFDRFLGRLLQNMPVDVMPGANDPSPVSIPQQPIPSQVFDAGAEVNPVTNPYSFSLAGLQFLGTSGQNVNDLAKCTRDLSPMELMERTLEMGHLFPTVPDTIAGFPFEKRDPLIVDRIPHVYFCGNQPTFEKKMVTLEEGKRCLLLAVPKFCESFELILLNLRTLDAIPYKFNPSLLDFELSADEEAIEE